MNLVGNKWDEILDEEYHKDYDSFLDYHLNDDYFVKVKAYVRIVYFINNKFKAKYIEDAFG